MIPLQGFAFGRVLKASPFLHEKLLFLLDD